MPVRRMTRVAGGLGIRAGDRTRRSTELPAELIQHPTPDAQRRTPNERRIRVSTWKNDCLNSARGLFAWLMLFRIRGQLIILPGKSSAAQLLHMAITVKQKQPSRVKTSFTS